MITNEDLVVNSLNRIRRNTYVAVNVLLDVRDGNIKESLLPIMLNELLTLFQHTFSLADTIALTCGIDLQKIHTMSQIQEIISNQFSQMMEPSYDISSLPEETQDIIRSFRQKMVLENTNTNTDEAKKEIEELKKMFNSSGGGNLIN